MKKITKKQVKELSNLPLEYNQLAETVLNVAPNTKLAKLATKFLEAQINFANKLDELGIELG